MTTVLRATDDATLLVSIPVLAGFTPTESVVLLPFIGSRTHGVLRVDVPPEAADVSAIAAELLGLVLRISDVTGIAIIVYSDHETRRLPAADLVSAITRAADRTELVIHNALAVTSRGWGSYQEPAVLHPLSDLPGTPDVPGVGDVSADQHLDPHPFFVPREKKAQVARAIAGLNAPVDTPASPQGLNPVAARAAQTLQDFPRFAEDLLSHPPTLSTAGTAALIWALGRPLLRDVAIVQWATDRKTGERALRAQLAYADQRTPVPDRLGAILIGEAARPDPDRLRIALSVVVQAAGAAPDAGRVGAWVVAGWLSWALGRSSHAADYIQRALRISSNHSMANLLHNIVNSGMLPAWCFVATD